MLGIFDSGLGGLTALKEIRKKLPGEELVYFGDTGRVPYGTRSRDTIIKYAVQDMDFLMSFGPRAIIAACGTVSTTALPVLREKFDIPIIGVVEGAAERAAQITKNGIVGVIGTAATIGTNAFEKAIKAINPDIKVVSKACPLFVPMVECGYIDKTDEITRAVCRRYLPEIAESHADTLILGCTHYPIIEEAISAELPGVTLINTGAEAARKAAELLGASPESAGSTRYYVSDDVSMFNATASVFLGTGIDGKVERVSVG